MASHLRQSNESADSLFLISIRPARGKSKEAKGTAILRRTVLSGPAGVLLNRRNYRQSRKIVSSTPMDSVVGLASLGPLSIGE
jgi:hypothetical protein